MKPWEDTDLLAMIVFAQQNPDCDKGPLKDYIQQKEYLAGELIANSQFIHALFDAGYKGDSVDWFLLRHEMGIPTANRGNFDELRDQPAIPFEAPL